MYESPANHPVLVGERVHIVAPSPLAGHTGRVIDYQNVGRGFLVAFDDGREKWVEAECIRRAQVDDSHRLRPAAMRHPVEAAMVADHHAVVTVTGTVVATSRRAYVPKSGKR